MKLLAVETCSSNFISGFIECEQDYARFSIEKGKSAIFHARFKKTNYIDYETFAAVMGKFLPSFTFLRNPPNIHEDMDFGLLRELVKSTPTFSG